MYEPAALSVLAHSTPHNPLQVLADARAAVDAAVDEAHAAAVGAAGGTYAPPAASAQAFYETFLAYNELCERAISAPASTVVRDVLLRRVGDRVEPPPTELSSDTSAVVYLQFASLKNRFGVERAFLCGALALPAEALPSLPSRAFIGPRRLPRVSTPRPRLPAPHAPSPFRLASPSSSAGAQSPLYNGSCRPRAPPLQTL